MGRGDLGAFSAASAHQHRDAVHGDWRRSPAGSSCRRCAAGPCWRCPSPAPRSRSSRRSAGRPRWTSAASRSGSWGGDVGCLPGGAVVDRHVHGLDLEVAGPGRAPELDLLGAGRKPRAVGGTGDDAAHRHRLHDLEVGVVGLAAGQHRLDGDAIGGAGHAGAVVHLVAQRDLVEPLVRGRARPAGMTRRSGAPWMLSSGLPFIAHTSRLC